MILEASRDTEDGHAIFQVAPGVSHALRGKIRELGIGVPLRVRGETPRAVVVIKLLIDLSTKATE